MADNVTNASRIAQDHARRGHARADTRNWSPAASTTYHATLDRERRRLEDANRK